MLNNVIRFPIMVVLWLLFHKRLFRGEGELSTLPPLKRFSYFVLTVLVWFSASRNRQDRDILTAIENQQNHFFRSEPLPVRKFCDPVLV
jgi:hypothetical protein